MMNISFSSEIDSCMRRCLDADHRDITSLSRLSSSHVDVVWRGETNLSKCFFQRLFSSWSEKRKKGFNRQVLQLSSIVPRVDLCDPIVRCHLPRQCILQRWRHEAPFEHRWSRRALSDRHHHCRSRRVQEHDSLSTCICREPSSLWHNKDLKMTPTAWWWSQRRIDTRDWLTVSLGEDHHFVLFDQLLNLLSDSRISGSLGWHEQSTKELTKNLDGLKKRRLMI